jgi:hypothetical protein
MTGLITARVCADHFENVVIIEADEGADITFPSTSKRKDIHGNTTLVSRRPRVAQTFELHREYHPLTHFPPCVYHINIVYQPFALLTLRRLIPDFDQKLTKAGGRIKPWKYNAFWSGTKLGCPFPTYLSGNGLPRHPNLPKEDLPNTIWLPRANLEVFLRKEVLTSCENVRVIHGTVIGLHENEEVKGTIDKVRYSVKGEMGIKEQEATLVIGERPIA